MTEHEIPAIFPKLLSIFIPLDSEKPGVERGQQSFRDYMWHGLPMDNQADYELLPTEFTEIWVPLSRTQEVMRLLRSYFAEPRDDRVTDPGVARIQLVDDRIGRQRRRAEPFRQLDSTTARGRAPQRQGRS